MTKVRAQQLFNDVLDMYESLPDFKRDRINPALKFHKRTTALGTCRTYSDWRGIHCEIYLSIYAMESEESVMNTLAHEVAHTFDGCQNHGIKFHNVGERFRKVTGIVIDTRASAKDAKESGILDAKKNNSRYILECTNCGDRWYYQRTCRVVSNYRTSYCSKCGKIKGRLNLITRA